MRTSFEEQTLPDVPGQTDSNLKLFFQKPQLLFGMSFFVTFFFQIIKPSANKSAKLRLKLCCLRESLKNDLFNLSLCLLNC